MSGDLEENIREQIRKNEEIYKAYQRYRTFVPAINFSVKKVSTKNLQTYVDLELLTTKELWKMDSTLKDIKKGFQYLEDEVSTTEYTFNNTSSGALIGSIFGGIAVLATGSFLPLVLPIAGAILTPPLQQVQRQYRMRDTRKYAQNLSDNVQMFNKYCENIHHSIEKKELLDERQMLRSLHRFNDASQTLRECLGIKQKYEQLTEVYQKWNH